MLGFWRLFWSLGGVFSLWLTAACTHTPPVPAQKPYDQCICGPLTDVEQKPFCAIWGSKRRLDAPEPVYQAEPGQSCTPQDCSRFFSRFCKAIQMAPPAPTKAVTTAPLPKSCYCDQVLIENDKGQAQALCAAWAEGGTHLIEYYALSDCSPERCRAAPFYRAKALCRDNFQSFYPPLPRR